MGKVYIICRPSLLGPIFIRLGKKPDLSRYWPEGTKIYEADIIAEFKSVNTVKEGTDAD